MKINSVGKFKEKNVEVTTVTEGSRVGGGQRDERA